MVATEPCFSNLVRIYPAPAQNYTKESTPPLLNRLTLLLICTMRTLPLRRPFLVQLLPYWSPICQLCYFLKPRIFTPCSSPLDTWKSWRSSMFRRLAPCLFLSNTLELAWLKKQKNVSLGNYMALIGLKHVMSSCPFRTVSCNPRISQRLGLLAVTTKRHLCFVLPRTLFLEENFSLLTLIGSLHYLHRIQQRSTALVLDVEFFRDKTFLQSYYQAELLSPR